MVESYDNLDELDELEGTSAGSINGASGQAPPGLEDFWLGSDRESPNIIREMLTTSVDPKEFIPRSKLTKRDIAAIQRMEIKHKLWRDHEYDFEDVIWKKLAYSIAEGGYGREQAVKMYAGHLMRQMSRKFGRRRGRDLNGDEVEA